MTNPVQSPSSQPQREGSPAPRSVATAEPSGFTVEVSRAATAPVYVYRVTDTATGRVLVEIPDAPPADDAAGRRLDAKV